jgi:hypothetical protein
MDPRIQSSETPIVRGGNDSTRLHPDDEHRVGALLTRLGRETVQLVRQETALASKEIGENLNEAKNGAIAVATSLAILVPGVTVLLIAAAYGLSLYLELWAALLVVGGGALLIGAALALVGKKKMEPSNLEPTKTRQTLREDKQFIREQVTT